MLRFNCSERKVISTIRKAQNIINTIADLYKKNSMSGGFMPANIHLFEVNNRNTSKRYEICSTFAIKM